MDELDQQSTHRSLKWIMYTGVAITIAALFSYRQLFPLEPPDVTGCYSAQGAPDIVVDAEYLTVLQDSPIYRQYHLEHHKGWAITIEPGFDWRSDADGKIYLFDGFRHGEFLFVTGQLDETPDILDFELISQSLMRSIRYRRSAEICQAVDGTGLQ